MTSTTSTISSLPAPSMATVPPLRRWSSRIGALSLVGIAIAHTVVNAHGFAVARDTSWLTFVLFGPGVSLLAFAFAVAAWQYGRRVRSGAGGIAIRLAVACGGLLLGSVAVSVVRTAIRLDHLQLIVVPLGPGPWSLIGTPALLIAALTARVRPRPSGVDQSSSA